MERPLLYAFAAVYSGLILTILLHWQFARIAFRKALMEDRDRVAVSLAWAWVSFTEILAAQQYWGSSRFGNITDYPKPKLWRLFLPHKLAVLLCVLVYQYFLRRGPVFGSGDCPSTPNCSSYLVGCLRRYPLLTSLAKAHIRVKTCVGQPAPRYTENFM